MAVAVAVGLVFAWAAPASAQQQTFANNSPITLTQGVAGSPYPSTIDVSGMGGTLSDVNVTLSGVTLAATNMDFLLAAPNGVAVLLSSDVPTAVAGQTWTFDDAAAGAQITDAVTGIYKTTDLVGVPIDDDALPDPAPAESAASLASFNGSNANGTWKLYAADTSGVLPIALGQVSGWALQLTTITGITSAVPGSKDFGSLAVGQTSALQTFTITNVGDAAMTITATQLEGSDSSNFVLAAENCLNHTFDPAQTCTVDVLFKPVSDGAKSASLVLADDTGVGDKFIALTGTGLAPLLGAQPGGTGGQSPGGGPAGQQTESGSPQVTIESATFQQDGPTTAGQPTTLHVEASDDKQPVTGLLVDFGETLGLYGASACVDGARKGNSAIFDVPYRFTTPGTHTVTVTIFAGGCGHATAHTMTFSVVVAGPKAARRVARAATTLAGPDITSKCKNASLMPSKPKAELILKALLCVMNEQRKLAKLKPLKLSKKLNKAALAHTRSMVAGKFFAHQGPKEPALVARLKKAKYRGSAGENIGAGGGPLGSPLQMVNGWMHSSLHRANLLSKTWRTVGIGFLPAYPVPTASSPVATFTTDFGVKP